MDEFVGLIRSKENRTGQTGERSEFGHRVLFGLVSSVCLGWLVGCLWSTDETEPFFMDAIIC